MVHPLFDGQGMAIVEPAPEETVQRQPLPWTAPEAWDMDEPVCLGLSSYGSVEFSSHVSTVGLVMADRAITGPVFASTALVYVNRQRLVDQFLAHPELGGWLWMLDADMVVEPLTARMLVTCAKQCDLDVIGATAPTVTGRCESRVGVETAEGPRLLPLAEPAWGTVTLVDAMGTGCMLISRSLLERMEAAFPHGRLGALFCPTEAETEDYCFCLRAGSLGARIGTLNLPQVRHRKVGSLALASQAVCPAVPWLVRVRGGSVAELE